VLPGFQSTQKDWLAAEAEYKAQADVLGKAKATLNQTWLEYQATVDAPVKATADGMVANLSVAPGQTVSATDTALVIKTEAQTWVKVGLSESDITQVQPGQKAVVSVDALKGKEYPALVQRVDEFGTNISDVIVYYVYLTLDQADEQIRPAMTVQAAIATQEKNEALVVPATALKPYQGAKAVQVLDPTTKAVIYKPVTVGISDDVMVEVLSGLSEGEQIITSTNSTSESSSKSGGGFLRPPN
jgi:RND family efflux transporter MFP subunit